MIADNQGDPINVDLEKASSKDFEIRTMADDLSEAAGVKKPETVNLAKTPPPSPLPPKTPPSSPAAPQGSGVPNLTPDMLFEEEPQGSWLKSFLVGFILVIIVGVIGVGGWWWYTSRSITGIATAPTTAPILPTTPPASPAKGTSLILVDKSLDFEVTDSDRQASFFAKLSSLLDTSKEGLAHDQVVRVVIKKGDKELMLRDLGALVGVDLTAYAKDSDAFTLVFGVPESTPVLGLIVPLKNALATKATFLTKEKDLPSVANSIYSAYAKQSLPQAASKTFLENIYQGVTIRYLNFDSPSRSFDYAFYNETLLVAGSREMTFNLIDRAKVSALLNGQKGTSPKETKQEQSPQGQ